MPIGTCLFKCKIFSQTHYIFILLLYLIESYSIIGSKLVEILNCRQYMKFQSSRMMNIFILIWFCITFYGYLIGIKYQNFDHINILTNFKWKLVIILSYL